jgi:hypothetical protein
MDVKNMPLIKAIQIYVIEGNIHDIKSFFCQNVFIYKLQC